MSFEGDIWFLLPSTWLHVVAHTVSLGLCLYLGEIWTCGFQQVFVKKTCDSSCYSWNEAQTKKKVIFYPYLETIPDSWIRWMTSSLFFLSFCGLYVAWPWAWVMIAWASKVLARLSTVSRVHVSHRAIRQFDQEVVTCSRQFRRGSYISFLFPYKHT